MPMLPAMRMTSAVYRMKSRSPNTEPLRYTQRWEIRVSTDPGNPGYPGKTLEFKRILEFLEKPWNSVENPGKITLKSIFVDICRYFVDWVDRICSLVDRICTVSRISGSSDPAQ